MTMNLPEDWADYLSSLDNVYIFASEQRHGGLVTFASETTRCCGAVQEGAVVVRLTLDLSPAQRLQRASGLEVGPTFDATMVNKFRRRIG